MNANFTHAWKAFAKVQPKQHYKIGKTKPTVVERDRNLCLGSVNSFIYLHINTLILLIL